MALDFHFLVSSSQKVSKRLSERAMTKKKKKQKHSKDNSQAVCALKGITLMNQQSIFMFPNQLERIYIHSFFHFHGSAFKIPFVCQSNCFACLSLAKGTMALRLLIACCRLLAAAAQSPSIRQFRVSYPICIYRTHLKHNSK